MTPERTPDTPDNCKTDNYINYISIMFCQSLNLTFADTPDTLVRACQSSVKCQTDMITNYFYI